MMKTITVLLLPTTEIVYIDTATSPFSLIVTVSEAQGALCRTSDSNARRKLFLQYNHSSLWWNQDQYIQPWVELSGTFVFWQHGAIVC